MKKIVTLFLLSCSLFASLVLNLNVLEQKKRVDLIINFDIPYEGKIAQKNESGKIVLYLQEAKILSPWQKKLDNPFVYQIDVLPAKNGSKIILYTSQKVKIRALRSKDGFSLKISIMPLNATISKKDVNPKSSSLETILYWLGAAIVIILILIAILKLITLFSKPKPVKKIVVDNLQPEFTIKFEKPLDEHNKIALISFKGTDYLVLTGSSNVLLDKYKEGQIVSEADFHAAIEEQNLEEALKPQKEDEFFMTLEEYKKKASGKGLLE